MIKIFLHIATIGEYQSIGNELIYDIAHHKLLSNCSELNVCIVGNGEFILENNNSKIKIHRVGEIEDFEFPTLQMIENSINNVEDNLKIFYLNGLGVTDNSVYKKSWRSYLSYFNITRFDECVKSLDDGYDVCGVDWRTDPSPHFSGNFWWANSRYLKSLPKINEINKQNSPRVLTLRHNAEMYIGMNVKVNPRILWQSNISQYSRHLHTYDKSNYVGKINKKNIIIDNINI